MWSFASHSTETLFIGITFSFIDLAEMKLFVSDN